MKFEKIENNHNQNPENEYRHFNPYTKENKMVPCVVPYELKNLSFFEKLLISRINPIMSVVTIENRNLKIKKFKGHIINISQDITKIATIVPRLPEDLKTILIKKKTQKEDKFKLFKINKEKIRKGITMAQITQPLLQKHRDRHIKDRESINTKIF